VTLVVWLVTTCPARLALLLALLVALCGHLMATWVALHGAGRCWVCAADNAAGGAGDAAEGAVVALCVLLVGTWVGAAGGALTPLAGRYWAALWALLGARYALDGFVGGHVAMWRSGSGLALAGAALRDPLL